METRHCDDCVFAKRQTGRWWCSLREEHVSQEWSCERFLNEYETLQWQCRFSKTPPANRHFSTGDIAAIFTIILGLTVGIGFCIWGCVQ